MPSLPRSRLMTVQLGAATEQGEARVRGRSVHAYWFLLAPHFRAVLLVPHRHVNETGTVWSWSEPATEAAGLSAVECTGLRQRLQEGIGSLEDAVELSPANDAVRQAILRDLAEAMARVVRRLLTLPDGQLAAFACRTDAGVLLHSWGATLPGRPFCAAAASDSSSGAQSDGDLAAAAGGGRAKAVRRRAWLIALGLVVGLTTFGIVAWPHRAASPVAPAQELDPAGRTSETRPAAGPGPTSPPSADEGHAPIQARWATAGPVRSPIMPGIIDGFPRPETAPAALDAERINGWDRPRDATAAAGSSAFSSAPVAAAMTRTAPGSPPALGARAGRAGRDRLPAENAAKATEGDRAADPGEVWPQADPAGTLNGWPAGVVAETGTKGDAAAAATAGLLPNLSDPPSAQVTLQDRAVLPDGEAESDAVPPAARNAPVPADTALPAEARPIAPDRAATAAAAWLLDEAAPGRGDMSSAQPPGRPVDGRITTPDRATAEMLPAAAKVAADRREAGAGSRFLNGDSPKRFRRVLVSHTAWTAQRIHDPILPTAPVRIGAPDTTRQLRVRMREEMSRELPPLPRPPTISLIVRSDTGASRLNLGEPLEGAPTNGRCIAVDTQGNLLAQVEPVSLRAARVSWCEAVVVSWRLEVQDEASSPEESAWEWQVGAKGEAPSLMPTRPTATARPFLVLALPEEPAGASTRTVSVLHLRTGWAWTSEFSLEPE